MCTKEGVCVVLCMSVCVCMCLACVCLHRSLRRSSSSEHPGPGCGFQMLPSIERSRAPGQRSEDKELEDRMPRS